MGKDAFIATNFVLVPITSLSQGPISQGPRSQGPMSQVSGSQGPGSRVSGPDFSLFSEHLFVRTPLEGRFCA